MREWLREMRTKSGITQGKMAEELHITQSYYSMIEDGERQKKLDLTLAAKLAVIFSVPIEQIVQLEGE